MNPDLLRLMKEATRLTATGKLKAATAAIRAALGAGMAARAPAPVNPNRPVSPNTPSTGGAPASGDVVDVEAREIPVTPPASRDVPPSTQPAREAPGPGSFVAGGHTDAAAGSRNFKLYIPPAAGQHPLPLVVMLHGCTQNPDDFAAGTAMNALAQSQGFFVLYPAQSPQANPQGCWNWFKHSHQARGHGEPALLAGMTREVMARHPIDPARVYVAGLSAGGAMAAILGDTYPELFAAVGVHSGLAAGIAKDLPSAMGAMRGAGRPAPVAASGMPTIVFHGDADSTVHPTNGEQVVAASAGAASKAEAERLQTDGGRAFTRTLHRAAHGEVVSEHWLVHGAPHAWSGGNANGSYTDASGPDASAEMVRFFMAHPRRKAP